MAVTLRFQSTGVVPGNAGPVTMRGPSLTIGRGDDNDFVLPDPDRLLSKRHCVIEDHGGSMVVIDLSTNGTFLNYGRVPLGRVPTPLSDGDILTIGPYELVVAIGAAAGPRARAIPDPIGADDPLAGLGDAHRPGLAGPLDAAVGGDDVDFLDELLGGAPIAGPGGVMRPALGEDGLKQHIKTIGLFNSKAKNVIEMSRLLIERHGGEVPADRTALEALPGVGRKTANVVLNIAFGQPTIAVDTHLFRVSNRTGLAPGKTPLAVELGLEKRIPAPYLRHAHHWLILHGRYICKARKPDCWRCIVSEFCKFKDKTPDPALR